MILQDMFHNVSSNFDTLPYYNEIIGCFNTIIRRVNAEMELPDQRIEITQGGADDWEDWTTTNWEALTTTNWEDYLRFASGYSWNAADYCLSLPQNVTKVKTVYIEDMEFSRVGYDELKESEETDLVFAQVGRDLFFTYDLSTILDDLFIVCQKPYPLIDSGDTEYTDMRENFQALLESGAVYMLSVKPRYKNADMAQIYKEMFEKQWLSLTDQILNEEVRLHLKPNYTF